MFKTLLFCVFSACWLSSCQKLPNPNANARLFFSADSISFDTIFTSTGTITQQIKLINNNPDGIGISQIRLMGGTNSSFIINIDGKPGPNASNLYIGGTDSLHIFITVFIKPGAEPRAFILEDSILVQYNGINQYIQLRAWGQNAHFLKNQVIEGNTKWSNDLPYVIYGSLRVDSNAALTIEPGTHIYIHADAPFFVDGTLNVLGGSADSLRVYFSGDRTDLPYSGYPGSWPGIHFRITSRDNLLNYAVFQNSYQTLITEGPGMGLKPKLSLNQCIINNSLREGILAIRSSISAINCLFSNCGQNIVIGLGGTYKFEHCTVASYSTYQISHAQPVLSVSNSGSLGSQIFTSDLNARFINCIFWGSDGIQDEALISKQGNTVFQVLFDHSILKQQNYPPNIDSSFLWLNTNPRFLATGNPGNAFNFQLGAGSPAVDLGANLGVLIDLQGDPRPVNQPDLGCYERQ